MFKEHWSQYAKSLFWRRDLNFFIKVGIPREAIVNQKQTGHRTNLTNLASFKMYHQLINTIHPTDFSLYDSVARNNFPTPKFCYRCRYANLLGTTAGFFGSIKNLIINGVYYDLGFPGQAIVAVNVVQNSSFDPCMMTPCEHGGTCSVDGDRIQCDCMNGFLGDRCEIRGACCGIKHVFVFPPEN